ncbi:DUF4307 domain-containing protein [Rhodococcus pyridinivorans]|uniref:DUF4307 domain-containing protein n=1 Tax=Rhodococcus pyridinivorans AK37 TaxID=1114960 RepID=H0JW84_9NOCA|nr:MULTISPECIES: DUF4307 domain-containing protein [Rhodococcus]AOD22169.1 hypothetical protein IM25_11580 [Rhodococcus sp. p52]AWZ24179.1 hypothetical protein CEJ39_08290 [Rhodococcus pyridinivorans]EHK81635.1 hypothetical protein AK37_19793 [Rhodococcus pyridinivorans AK37]MCD2142623.1 DUF4307 domain-containing protein [Rhodococcus pyridinivorans]UPW03698.1 DUF4307 domain-containing protein [Rhodococcus pyridinivorans]
MSNTLPTDRYPSSRYPGPRVSTRGKRWGFTIAGLLAGLVVAFVLFQNNSAPIESEVVAFEIIDDSTIDIQLKVTRDDPSEDAVCIIRARSKDGSETGRREVLIPASDSQTVVLTSTVKTSQRPGMGDTYGCSTEAPVYLRAP